MKKIVLLLIVCLLGTAQFAEAQLIRSSQTVITKTKKEKVKKEKKVLDPVKAGLQQEISVEVGGFDVNDMQLSGGVNYTIGYRFNNTLFIGGGLGLGYGKAYPSDDYAQGDHVKVIIKYPDYYEIEWPSYISGARYSLESIYAQLFGNIRIYLTKTRVQPYFDLSLGGIYMKQERKENRLRFTTTIFDTANELQYYVEQNIEEYTEKKEFSMFANPQFGINWRLNNRYSLNLAVGYKWLSSYDIVSGYPQVKIGFSF